MKTKLEELLSSTYSGILNNEQIYGNTYKGKRYVRVEYPSLNDYQIFLYNRALYGLSVYSQEEIKTMSSSKRKRIIKVHKRAQSVINIWKQQIVNLYCAKVFISLFPPRKNQITRDILSSVDDVDPDHTNRMSFRELGITKPMVIKKFIEEGILPHNFYKIAG